MKQELFKEAFEEEENSRSRLNRIFLISVLINLIVIGIIVLNPFDINKKLFECKRCVVNTDSGSSNYLPENINGE